MIFVTVGNGKFDELIKKIDQLKEKKIIKEEIITQIGNGKYHPAHCKWFNFKSSLNEYYQEADLIISHGGPGIVFEVLNRKKKLIAVPNRNRTDPNHQVEFLKAIAKESKALIYCDDIKSLHKCIDNAKTHNLKIYKKPECQIHKVIHNFLRRKNNDQ